MNEAGFDNPPDNYLRLLRKIKTNPYRQEVFDEAVNVAENEESTPKSSLGFYGLVPLQELVDTAQRLRTVQSLEEKYRVLAERSSTGLGWYDIVLGHVNDKSLKFLGDELGRKRWHIALDVGTGTGNSLAELKKHADKVVGVDKLRFLLEVAREGSSRPENLVTGTAAALPFQDRSFDLVVAQGMTYYLNRTELSRFADEIDRVLVPGGSYFEAAVYPGKNGDLPVVEQEYLSSGKGMLVCLMDEMITYKPELPPTPLGSDFTLFFSEFQRKGFTTNFYDYRNGGVAVLEVKKP